MNAYWLALILTAFLLGGCRASRDVAVTSYHVTRSVAVGSYRVATAPVHYALRRHADDSSTAATTLSDVTEPGQSVPPPEVASAPQPQPRVESERTSGRSSSIAPRKSRETAQSRTKPSSS